MKERINKMIKMIESGDIKGFLDDIDQVAASKAFVIIRDNIKSRHIKMIKESGIDNYQLFQDIKIRAKQSWDYDHKTPSMNDIDRACTNVYVLALRLMKVHNDAIIEELNAIRSAINKIEEKIGIDPTVWEQDLQIPDINDKGDNNVGNVQRIEEDIR